MRTIILGLGTVLVVACGSSGRTAPDDADIDAVVASDAMIDGTIPPEKGCGGIAVECKPTEYCDYTDNRCGIADGPGVCKRRPDACPLIVGRPVCACDGKIHSSECIAFSDGSDLNANGSCPVPSGAFACGYAVCDLQTQYCRHEIMASSPDIYSCAPLPAGCTGTPTCTCLRGEQCIGTASCSGEARTGLTLTCQ